MDNLDSSTIGTILQTELTVELSLFRSNLRTDSNNISFLYVDPQIVILNSGFFSNIYIFCQIVISLFSLFISINYINAGRVWFLVILILSLLHVVLSDFMLSYVSDESGSYNTTMQEETLFGVDREYAKLHIRAIAPFTHYFTVILIFLLSVVQEIPLTCIRTVGQCNLTVKKTGSLALNIGISLISLLILPQAYFSAWYMVENLTVSNIELVLVFCTCISVAAVLLLCIFKFRSYGGYANAVEAELARRRATVTFIFYLLLFSSTMLMTPNCSGLFELEPWYEIFRLLGIFIQIATIPMFVKLYVFALLPYKMKKPLSPQGYTSPAGFDPGSLKETVQYAICLPIIRPRPRKPEKVEVLPEFDEIPMSSVYPPPDRGDPRTRRAPGQFLAPPKAQTYRA